MIEATSIAHIVMGILWACSPGNVLGGHSDIMLQLSLDSLGYLPRLEAQFWISLLWQVLSFIFFLQAANVRSTKKHYAPTPVQSPCLHGPKYLGLSHIMHCLEQKCF